MSPVSLFMCLLMMPAAMTLFIGQYARRVAEASPASTVWIDSFFNELTFVIDRPDGVARTSACDPARLVVFAAVTF